MSGIYENRRKRGATRGIERPKSQATRIDGRREITAAAASGYRSHHRGTSGVKRRRARNVRNSLRPLRERGGCPQYQTTRADGQSVTAPRGSREFLSISGFGIRAHSRRRGDIKRGSPETYQSPRIGRSGSPADRLGSPGALGGHGDRGIQFPNAFTVGETEIKRLRV